MTNFFKRSLSAIILLGIFAFSFFLSNDLFFLILIYIFFLISLFEMSTLLKLKMIEHFLYWFISLVLFVFNIFDSYNINFIIFISAFFWIFIAPYSVLKAKIVLESTKFLYGPIILLGLLISTSYLFVNNKYLLLFSFIIVWISDIFAYLTGKLFGKTKLAPNVSPGKTLEGIYGSIISNLLLVLIFSKVFDYSFLHLALLSLVIIPLSIYGDLFESLLKRKANIKDSGNIIPGHGGVLDRIDGLCSTLPVIAVINLFGFGI
jgi:phosphatidate cytidylyltransferase